MFRKIKELKFLYEVNEKGIVRNVKTQKVLKGDKGINGYIRYKFENKELNIKGYIRLSGHRIVAKEFIPNPLNKLCVNHKNSIRDDNRVENLEWVTHSENMKHGYLNNPTIKKCLDYGRTQTKKYKNRRNK